MGYVNVLSLRVETYLRKVNRKGVLLYRHTLNLSWQDRGRTLSFLVYA